MNANVLVINIYKTSLLCFFITMICHYIISKKLKPNFILNKYFIILNEDLKFWKKSSLKKLKMSNNKDISDELFDLKTAFYLGNYQQAINEAQKLRVKYYVFLLL